jgi:hypothetical protein
MGAGDESKRSERRQEMAKVSASFDDQQQADAVVSELGHMNIDGLDWRVHQPGNDSAGAAPIVGLPAGMAGNGVRAADGGPAVVPPFFATGADRRDGTGDDAGDYLRQARARGATVIEVDAPSGMEDAVQDLFSRHGAANMTVG